MVEALAWHNGRVLPVEEASPSAASMSLNMGLAVFDGLMAYRNDGDYRLHAAAEHFERLRTGSTRMGFPISWTVPQLIGAVRELLAQVPPATYYVRPIVYRGARHLWLTGIDDIPVDTTIVVAPVGRDVDAGLRVGFSPVQRVSSHAVPVSWKISGSYVNSYLARRRAIEDGYDDALMLDQAGRITEATAANVFFVRGRTVLTPELSGDVFPGVTRRIVIALLARMGVEVREVPLHPADTLGVSAAFISSTLLELRPIEELHGTRLDTATDDVFVELLRRFRDLTHGGDLEP